MKHKSVTLMRFIPPIRRTLSAISIVLSLVIALAAFGSVGTSWTYQGQLRRSGAAYNGTCNFQFSLWDDAVVGIQQGATQSINNVSVVNGLFTVTLDFGNLFDGNARWLGTSVQCSGDGGFTALGPRQTITATPYALTLRPGATIIDSDTSASGRPALFAQSLITNGTGLVGNGQTGVYGSSLIHLGVGVKGVATEFGSCGVDGRSIGQNGIGIRGSADGDGALAGKFEGGVDVVGPLTTTNTSSSGIGVDGSSFIGVHGKTTSVGGSGVWGEALLGNSAGVFGTNRDSAAIWGRTTGNGSAIYGERFGGAAGYAGYFAGPVHVQGTLTKSAGTFKIDHPLDPANKFLSHSFVESPDMKNIYDGNVTTGASGSATVTLPDYFAALNRDFRYQLTVLGQFAQAIVSREIAGNSFEIQTDKPGVKVSWQVTGIRQDAYAKANPIKVEEFKPAEQKGFYLYPAGFGTSEEKRIGQAPQIR